MQKKKPEKEVLKMQNCEECWNYVFDERTGTFYCQMDLDEDEMSRFLAGARWNCPYFRFNDEYEVVRKQN